MSKTDVNKLVNLITKGKTEEDIKNAYAKYFELTYETSDRHDGIFLESGIGMAIFPQVLWALIVSG
jgi:hypothetical protein